MTASLPIDTALVFDSVENIYGQFKKILAQCALNGHKTINIIRLLIKDSIEEEIYKSNHC